MSRGDGVRPTVIRGLAVPGRGAKGSAGAIGALSAVLRGCHGGCIYFGRCMQTGRELSTCI